MALRIGELVGVLRADASGWERGLDRAQVRLAGLQRDTAGRLRDMNGRFVNAGEYSGRGFGRSLLGSIGGVVRRGIGTAVEAGMSGLRSAMGAISSNPYVASIGGALAAGVAAAALPAIGALISAGVISVAGIGIIGLGYAVLKNEPEVKKAAKKLKKTIGDTLKEAAQPLKGSLVDAMGALRQTAKDVAPSLKRIFRSVADSGALKSLTDGIDKLVKNALPGFEKMMKKMGPTFEGLEELMSDVGEGLSAFFSEIGKSGPETKLVLEDIGELIKYLLFEAGRFIGWLAKAYDKVRWFVEKVIEGFEWLYDVLVGHSVIPDLINAVIDWFASLPGKILGKLGEFVGKVKDKFVSMKDKAVGKVRDMVNKTVDWVEGLPGRAVRALEGWAGDMAGKARDAGGRLVSAIRERVNSAVSYVRGLPGRAVRALGNLGSRLWSAGASLIGGFIRGIWSQIGRVRDAAASVVSAARNFFPFSPAKEGPFSGSGYTTHSGRALIDGFRKGIAQQLPALRRDLGALDSGMPALGVAGGIGVMPGRAGQAVARREPPVHVTVQVGERVFGQFLIDTARREVSKRGGDVQVVIGQKGR